MSESFISYRSFHEALKSLTIEQYGTVMYAINEYALNQNEIELTGIEKMAFTLIKPQLDANIRRQETGTKGGRPKKENNSDENKKPMVSEKTENKKPMVIFSDENKKPNKNKNDNENINSNENKNEEGEEEGEGYTAREEKSTENAGNLPPPPPHLSGPQREYSQIVFEKFKSAGLPCQKGDLFKFQACDFRLALQKIKGLSSQEVISAVDNYIFELKNPESYQLREYSFDNFVNSRTFSNCLPANYRTQNFKKYTKDIPKEPERNDEPRHFYVECPKCGQKLMEWNNQQQKYTCMSCGIVMTWEEVENGRSA